MNQAKKKKKKDAESDFGLSNPIPGLHASSPFFGNILPFFVRYNSDVFPILLLMSHNGRLNPSLFGGEIGR